MSMHNKFRRPSLKDIADKAGVSIATVDRVMNGRGLVKPATVELIRGVAESIGYESPVDQKPVRFGILLQDPKHSYYQELARCLESEASCRVGVSLDISYLSETGPDTVAGEIERFGKCDAIAAVMVEHPAVHQAVTKVVAAGTPVIALLTDIRHPSRSAYVGVDNRTVGRTAGLILGRFLGGRTGKVVVTTETLNYLGLEEREMGFRAVLKERFPGVSLVNIIERDRDRSRSLEQVEEAFRDPDVVGVYVNGGRNSEIARALVRAGRDSSEFIFVGHELTDVSRGLLTEGIVDMLISFPAALAATETLNALMRAIGRHSLDVGRSFQPFHLHFAENAYL